MSVICQNFVQNAWKKDLCSNCFKSFSDHAASLEDSCSVILTSKEVQENEKNAVLNHLNGTRYISQATTIYESWKSLIEDQKSTAFVLLKTPERVERNADAGNPVVAKEKSDQPSTNGIAQGILKLGAKSSELPRRNSVGFKEDHVQVIGYGGNDDYDSDEGNWEMSSDDDISLESLDCTEEEKVITKITKENTDFNANNENLLTPQQNLPHVPAENNSDDDKNSGESTHENVTAPEPVGEDSGAPSAPPEFSTPPVADSVPSTKDESEEMQSQPAEDSPADEEVQDDDPKVIAATLCTNSGPTPAIYEARSSFLHSITDTPMAIYTPASDLFVHRNSTSSSSSSEEESALKTPAKVAPRPLAKPKIPAKPVVKKEQAEPSATLHGPIKSGPSSGKDVVEVGPRSPPPATEKVVTTTHDLAKQSPEDASEVQNGFSEHGSDFVSTAMLEGGKNFDDGSIYYAVSEPFTSSPENEARNMNLVRTLHYSETNIYQEVKGNHHHPEKEVKLAALAVELEQARQNAPPKRLAPAPPSNPPEQQPTSAAKTESSNHYYTSRKLGFLGSRPKPEKDVEKANGTTSPTTVCKSPSPTESPDDSSAKNSKKSLFSLKKLLKRGNTSKDLTADDTPQSKIANNSVNPKAWKHAEFDKSRLRLEIVHPMDMARVSKDAVPTSATAEATNGACSPVRHLENGMYEGVTVEKYGAIVIPADCRNVHQLPGTAVQRSPLPDEKAEDQDQAPPPDSPSSSCSGSPGRRSARPPKPPPPPRCKGQTPPRPTPCTTGGSHETPSRKPVVPKRHLRHNNKTDYANLADDVRDWISGFVSKIGHIRSPMAPKKPQRSSSMASNSGENSGEEQSQPAPDKCDTNELVKRRSKSTEDNASRESESQEEELYSNTAVPLQASPPPNRETNDACSTSVRVESPRTSTQGDKPPTSPPPQPVCPDHASRRTEWLTLEASYSRITMSNYEALSKLLEHISSCSHQFPCESKIGVHMQWEKFEVESTFTEGGLQVSTATYKENSSKVTLLVTKRTSFLPPVPPLLKHRTVASYADSSNDTTVLVLPRGTVSSVNSSRFHSSPHAVAYVLLQVISTLKALQSTGMEEVESSSQKCWLVQWDSTHPQLVYLHHGAPALCEPAVEKLTLCQYVRTVVLEMLHYTSDGDLERHAAGDHAIFAILAAVLAEEKASSLSWAKRLLEYFLWAPWDLLRANWPVEVEAHLQRWLDTQRAEVWKKVAGGLHLDNLPCSVYLEHQVSFLVSGSGKSLKDISLFLNEKGFFRNDAAMFEGEELYQDGMLTPL